MLELKGAQVDVDNCHAKGCDVAAVDCFEQGARVVLGMGKGRSGADAINCPTVEYDESTLSMMMRLYSQAGKDRVSYIVNGTIDAEVDAACRVIYTQSDPTLL